MGRRRVGAASRLLLLCVLLTVINLTGSWHYYRFATDFNHAHRVDTRADAGVVFFHDFGDDEALSAASLARVDAARHLYRLGTVGSLLCVGGNAGDPPVTGAELMRRALIRGGVPGEAIVVDRDSFDTRSNWRNAETVLNAGNNQSVVLISSPMHLPRVYHEAHRSGLTLSVVPAPTDIEPEPLRLLRVWWAIQHEWLGWIAAWVLPPDLHQRLLSVWRRWLT